MSITIVVISALLTILAMAGQVEAQSNDFELSQEFPVSEEIQQEEENIPSVIENITNSVVGIVSSLTAESATGVNPEFDGSGFVYDPRRK